MSPYPVAGDGEKITDALIAALDMDPATLRGDHKAVTEWLAGKTEADVLAAVASNDGSKVASAAAALLNVLFIVVWTVYVAVAVTKIKGWSGLWWIFVVDALAAGLAIAVAGFIILRARVPDPDPPAATHVSVTIPPGAVAGQTLTVAAPGQPVVKFVVPAGLEAGATVQVPVGTKETA